MNKYIIRRMKTTHDDKTVSYVDLKIDTTGLLDYDYEEAIAYKGKIKIQNAWARKYSASEFKAMVNGRAILFTELGKDPKSGTINVEKVVAKAETMKGEELDDMIARLEALRQAKLESETDDDETDENE